MQPHLCESCCQIATEGCRSLHRLVDNTTTTHPLKCGVNVAQVSSWRLLGFDIFASDCVKLKCKASCPIIEWGMPHFRSRDKHLSTSLAQKQVKPVMTPQSSSNLLFQLSHWLKPWWSCPWCLFLTFFSVHNESERKKERIKVLRKRMRMCK